MKFINPACSPLQATVPLNLSQIMPYKYLYTFSMITSLRLACPPRFILFQNYRRPSFPLPCRFSTDWVLDMSGFMCVRVYGNFLEPQHITYYFGELRPDNPIRAYNIRLRSCDRCEPNTSYMSLSSCYKECTTTNNFETKYFFAHCSKLLVDATLAQEQSFNS